MKFNIRIILYLALLLCTATMLLDMKLEFQPVIKFISSGVTIALVIIYFVLRHRNPEGK